MSVPEQVPYKEYRATGSNNSFEITFYLPDPKDLVVMVNKEIPPVGAYSIQSNTVVFNTPPNEGDLVELTRDTQLDRETNFKSYDNSFRPETINFDLDKIWLVLQESNLVDAKILARLKQEIEWRRTHDFNYDELAQVREKQLFDALKGYTDALNAATNPGVFQGVIAGVVFAQDGKSVQTHLEEILEALAQERENIDSKADKSYVDEQLGLKADQQTTYNKTEVDAALGQKADQATTYTKSEVDSVVAPLTGGHKGYTTLALAQAAQGTLPVNSIVEVTNDPTDSNNGTYQWNGTTLTKSDYDLLTQAKLYADQGIKEFVNQSYVGPVQVLRNGVVWELPDGQTSNGSTEQSPFFDTRWIQKVYSETSTKLDKSFTPYVVINGTQQYDLNKRYSNLLDRAIKKISITGKNVERFKFIQLKTLSIKVSETSVSFSSKLCLLDSMSNAVVTKDLDLDTSINKAPDSNGIFTVYSKASDTQVELILDTKHFDLDVQYQYSATLKENGLLNYNAVEIVENKVLPTDVIGAANTYRGDSFALARGLKDITKKGDFSNRELHFLSLEKTATQVIVDFKVFDKKTGASIAYRQRIPNAEFIGILNLGLFAFSGANYRTVNCGVAVTLDADYLNVHYQDQGVTTWKISAIDANQPLLNKSKITEIRALDQYDFSQPGYADYRGMWYATSTYRRMAVGIKIPDGTTSIKATGGFDKNANILFGDVNGQMIHGGYAWKNEDGTKYSGDEVKTSLDVDIPVSAKYLHMSTTLATVPSATLNFVGDFEYAKKTDFESIQSAILDKTVQNGVYTSGKYLFRKNDTNINNVEVIDGSNLALADTYTASTLKQGTSQGQLAFYKDGKYYYYHGSNREIYVEENGVKTTLTSPTLHPAAWALSRAQQQQRTVIEVLEDESILFSMKETQVDGNITYSLWKMPVGGVPVRCFMYSNDFSTKADSSLQSANGCPLGEWSFAYAEGLIFATEYGEGTSKWWSDQEKNGGNGKGVSSRVWVSNDNGNTWYICLNLNELKDSALPQSDSNWKYFSDTNAKNYCHIHMIKYDTYDKRVYISNGDGENYLWSIDLKTVKTWLASAVAVNPATLPIYTQVTGLTWNAVRLCTYENQPNINYHNMKFQMTALYPIEQGLLMGHDAPREFMYLAHRKGLLSQSTFRFEPTYNWERSTDFDFDYEFKASQDTTDGFVQVMTRNKKTDPVLIFNSTSGKYCKIWATYNGFAHQLVFESELKEVTFGCRAFFDEKGNIILSTGAGATAINSGYYLLSADKA